MISVMPLSIRRAKARAAELRDTLEVGETWNCRNFERAFNFQERWQDLIRRAPKGLRADLVALGAQIAAESPPSNGRGHSFICTNSNPFHQTFRERRD